ncbi:MAG: hypothetical protein COA29_02470 [Porticoccus sp.]|nr:MAG: hypothetical protein COA29_02470 [Porticoccus sp.]
MSLVLRQTGVMSTQPIKLNNDPIIDCVIELRFVPSSNSVANVLPGLIMSQLKGKYPSIESTPDAAIPNEIRHRDPNLRYRPLVHLKGENTIVGVGDRSLVVVFPAPYAGWSDVKSTCLELFEVLRSSDLVTEIERVSIKYQNIIASESEGASLGALDMTLEFGKGITPRGVGTSVRCEYESDDTVSIIMVYSGVGAKVCDIDRKGLLVSVDTILTLPASFDSLASQLDFLHHKEKEVFFSLLTEETIEFLEPVWE